MEVEDETTATAAAAAAEEGEETRGESDGNPLGRDGDEEGEAEAEAAREARSPSGDVSADAIEAGDAAESPGDESEEEEPQEPKAEEGESQVTLSERASQSTDDGRQSTRSEIVPVRSQLQVEADAELAMEQRMQQMLMDDDDDDLAPSSVPSSVTDSEEAKDEEDDDDEESEAKVTREDLIAEYLAMLEEREELQQRRYFLENKLAEFFRKKRGEDKADGGNKTGQTADQEQRYVKYMAQLEDLRNEEISEHKRHQQEIEELKNTCQKYESEVADELESFRLYKRSLAMGAVNNRTGKPLTPKDIEYYEGRESLKTGEVVAVRLENIKLKNRLKKREQQLKAKEELAEGLHLIDFEQLKIENQTYNEKIEERNEELLKLRRKITSTVQVLTHLKEKLQFVQAENHVQKGKLRELETNVAQKRNVLSRTKQGRDALRIDNQRLRRNCGMLGNEALLRDFERRKDDSDMLEQKLERLKRQHAELTLSCSGVRKKIEQVRAIRF